MATHRHLLAVSCVTVAAAFIAGCGATPNRDAPAGTTVTEDGVAYSVQFSRELDPEAPDDRAMLGGLAHEPAIRRPDTVLLGVFVQAKDEAATPRTTAAAPQLVSAFGETFAPLRIPAGDPFAYRSRRLGPGDELPGPDTVAAESPEAGLMLVYRLPADVFLTDRPFTLRFGRSGRAASVQLDV